ncbi:phage holin family protein, partial [Enterococcus casseliflavus]|uniref:phage holin family protein n=2 Tax=Enterococcus TaxID=1350 RepID=UPI00232B84DC
FVLIILAKILDFIIKENGIQFQFSVYNLFISLLILTEIGSIVENLYESEFVEYLKQILKKAKDTITKDF